ncbi:MAG: protein translocase subunit SecD [Candidatus Cloacimonas sp.]|nr:protein translocase subunit SecD [Candidatus Cloacimonadota bacterium]
MKNRKIRNLLILAVLLVTVYYLVPLLPIQLPEFWTSKKVKLGLDLQGGMQIMLEVDYSELPEAEKDDAVSSAIEIVRNRIDQFGIAEPSIQRIGKNRIMIQLPGVDEFDRTKELIGKTALLEFKLVATPEQTEQAVDKIDKYLQQNIALFPYLEDFVSIDPIDSDLPEFMESRGTDKKSDADTPDDIFSRLITGKAYTVSYSDMPVIQKLIQDPNFKQAVPSGFVFALDKENRADPRADRDVYLLLEKTELTGNMLESAKVSIGGGTDLQAPNRPYVSLRFDRNGARIFENVTGQNMKRRLAIVLDDIVYTAPTIQDRIRGGEARITGSFTLDETQDLVIVLKAGNLPAPVHIVEERTVGPTLGMDSVRSGLRAGIIGLCLVIMFMLIYYKGTGLIADLVLVVNIAIILAALTALRAALTMPGIAGIILTMGMSVDANVLIFERIREELKSGKMVRSAVDSGFDRAVVTILDSNITTLISAIVLYQFGTGPIRGFAVTLSLGIIASMFTAVVMARAIFDSAVTNTTRTKLSI